MSYCDFIKNLPDSDRKNLHKRYHDHFYGFPIQDDNELFGRLILEINQAGLSWEIILKKEEAFREAFEGFDIKKVAHYQDLDLERLLQNPGIVRNRLKIKAVIYNAQKIIALQNEHGSFRNWLHLHHPMPKEDWVKLFKKNFKFIGGEIVGEFLMSIGLLEGAHHPNCPIHQQLKKLKF